MHECIWYQAYRSYSFQQGMRSTVEIQKIKQHPLYLQWTLYSIDPLPSYLKNM